MRVGEGEVVSECERKIEGHPPKNNQFYELI